MVTDRGRGRTPSQHIDGVGRGGNPVSTSLNPICTWHGKSVSPNLSFFISRPGVRAILGVIDSDSSSSVQNWTKGKRIGGAGTSDPSAHWYRSVGTPG